MLLKQVINAPDAKVPVDISMRVIPKKCERPGHFSYLKVNDDQDGIFWICWICHVVAPCEVATTLRLPLSQSDFRALAISLATEELRAYRAENPLALVPVGNFSDLVAIDLFFHMLYTVCALVREVVATAHAAIPTTQFGRRQEIVGKAPLWNDLRESVISAHDRIRTSPALPANLYEKSSYLFAANNLKLAHEAVLQLDYHFGSFDIWARRPRLKTVLVLIEAIQSKEPDAEQFLRYFKTNELKLDMPEQDGIIAQALLYRTLGSDVVPLEEARSGPSAVRAFSEYGEDELYLEICLRARLTSKVYERDERTDSRGRPAKRIFGIEIEQLYPTMAKIVQSAYGKPLVPNERGWNKITDLAGLPTSHRKVLILRSAGRITRLGNPSEWKKSDLIIKAERRNLQEAHNTWAQQPNVWMEAYDAWEQQTIVSKAKPLPHRFPLPPPLKEKCLFKKMDRSAKEN